MSRIQCKNKKFHSKAYKFCTVYFVELLKLNVMYILALSLNTLLHGMTAENQNKYKTNTSAT